MHQTPYQTFSPYPQQMYQPGMTQRQMMPTQQTNGMYMMYPQMPMQQAPQKQGFLSKLFGRKQEMPGMPQMMYRQQTNPYNTQPVMQPYQSSPYQMGAMPQYDTQQPVQRASQAGAAAGAVRMINPQTTATAAASTAANTTGGIGSFFSNVLSNPSAMLGNVEKVIQVAQKVGPVVQQYGPLVRSFPSIMKILNAPATSSETEIPEAPEEKPGRSPRRKKAAVQEADIIEATPEPAESKSSAPKLYV